MHFSETDLTVVCICQLTLSRKPQEIEETYQHSTSIDSLRSKETEKIYHHSTLG